MSRKLRVVLAIGVAEVLVAGLWLYLEELAREHPERIAADFHRTVGSTLGMVMGALLGFGLMLFLIARKNDRARGER